LRYSNKQDPDGDTCANVSPAGRIEPSDPLTVAKLMEQREHAVPVPVYYITSSSSVFLVVSVASRLVTLA